MGRFMNHKKWMAVIALAVTALILKGDEFVIYIGAGLELVCL